MRAEDRAPEVNQVFAGGLVHFDRLLKADEVASMFGVPVSWVREQSRTGDIPHIRLGRYVRYERQAVLDWLDGQRAGQWRKHKPNTCGAR